MKSQRITELAVRTAVSVAALGLLGFTGCQSTNYVRSDAAAGQLQTTAVEIRATITNLDATASALNDLLTNPTGDLRIQYDRFSMNLDQLSLASKRAFDEGPRLQRLSTSYFASWDKELMTISDEQIRRASTARKAEVSKEYASTIGAYQGCQESLATLLHYLRDIRQALSTDLTMAGLQSVKQPGSSARESAVAARSSLSQAASEIDALAAKMSFFVPTTAKPAQRSSGS
jgi:hypothetical protein